MPPIALIIINTIILSIIISSLIIYTGYLHFQNSNSTSSRPLWGTPIIKNKTIHDFAYGMTNNQTFENFAFRNYGKRQHRKKHLIFAGASNVSGLFLKNHQTLAFKIQEDDFFSNYEPYLLGYNGWGPHNLYIFQKSEYFNNHIKQDQGVFIYMFIPDHVKRVCGTEGYIIWSYGHSPWLEFKEKELKQVGYFSQKPKSITTLFYAGLYYQSKLLSLLLNDWDFLFTINDTTLPPKCLKKFATTISLMKKEYHKKFPLGKFLIMSYYSVPIEASQLELQKVQRHLDEFNLKIITFSNQKIQNELKKLKLLKKDLILKDGFHVSEKYHEFAIPFYKKILKK